MKGGTYTKILAKIQVRGIFRIQDIPGASNENIVQNYLNIALLNVF